MGRDHRGAIAVEFALIVPVLLLLLFGIVELGIVINRYVSVTHAAREGVRQLSVGHDTSLATIEAAEAKAVATTPELLGKITCDGVASLPGNDVRMVCSVPYELSLFVFDKTVTLTSTATMRKE